MKIKIFPIEVTLNQQLKYVIIAARYQNKKWIFVQHKERKTWEIPAGHIEVDEHPDQAAKRELYEETGATCFSISALFDYSVKEKNGTVNYGRIYFADVDKLDDLPESEIGKIKLKKKLPTKLTYPKLQPIMFQYVVDWLNDSLSS